MSQEPFEQREISEFTFSIEFPKARLMLPPAGTSNSGGIMQEGFLESETSWEAKLDHADKLDCTVAVASGIITGLI